jgi:hydrogenase nickel incorporation protein HypB
MCSTCGCAEGNLYIEGDEHRPHSAFAPRPSLLLPSIRATGLAFTPQSADGDLHYGHGEAGHARARHQPAQMLDVEINVLDKNNQLAARNRARFAARKLLVLKPGQARVLAKTTLLTET